MKDAGILDGDLAIVQSAPTVPPGAIAVAPANPVYRPIRIPRDDPSFRVGGRLIGVVRNLR